MMGLTCLACALRDVLRPAAGHPEPGGLDVVSHIHQAAASRRAGRQGQPPLKAEHIEGVGIASHTFAAASLPPIGRSSQVAPCLLANSKWLDMCSAYPVGAGGGGLGGEGLRNAGEEARSISGQATRLLPTGLALAISWVTGRHPCIR